MSLGKSDKQNLSHSGGKHKDQKDQKEQKDQKGLTSYFGKGVEHSDAVLPPLVLVPFEIIPGT